MAHKTLISGTAYSVTGGRELIGGTGYAKKKGRVLVDGTGYDIPFSSGIPLSTVALGDILMLNENGSPVPFYVCKHDYESGLNGVGRTLLVRKDCYDKRAFNQNSNTYVGSQMDTWLNGDYLNEMSGSVKRAVGTTKFKFASGTSNTISTAERPIFLLSAIELGRPSGKTDGEALQIATQLQIAKINGSEVEQWTRTPGMNSTVFETYLNVKGFIGTSHPSNSYGSRPAFTLPSTFPVIQNPDGTYTPAA